MGVKDIMWFRSASFPCQEPVIDLMDKGVVHHIEGSMNGPLGAYCSHGKMRGMGVLRSHGGLRKKLPREVLLACLRRCWVIDGSICWV